MMRFSPDIDFVNAAIGETKDLSDKQVIKYFELLSILVVCHGRLIASGFEPVRSKAG